MDVGRNRAGGGRSDADDDAGDQADPELDLDLEGALEGVSFGDEASDDEPSAEEDDVEGMFEEFEEASADEVMDAVESVESKHETGNGAGSTELEDEEVEGLFGDLSAVELDPDPVEDGAGTEPAATTETDTTPEVTTETEPTPDPRDQEEMEEEVEGLFDDLSAVDLEPDESESPTTATAETRETVLDTGADEPSIIDADAAGASAFDWLGEDVHVFPSGESDVEGMFEEFEESSPEDLIAEAGPASESTASQPRASAPEPTTPDRSASATFAALERDLSVPDGQSSPGRVRGWQSGRDWTNGTGRRTASQMYEAFAEEAPAVRERDPEPTASDGRPDDRRISDVEELELAVEDLAAVRDGTADEDPTERAVETEADVDAVFERFDESSPEEIIAAADDPAARTRIGGEAEAAVEQLFADLSDVDLEVEYPETTTEAVGRAPEPGSQAVRREIEGLLGDLSGVDLAAEPPAASEPAEEATAATDAAVASGSTEESTDRGDDGVLEQTGEDTHVAVGESDVDAVFERFDESSPEEIAEDAAAAIAEDAVAADPIATETGAASTAGEADAPASEASSSTDAGSGAEPASSDVASPTGGDEDGDGEDEADDLYSEAGTDDPDEAEDDEDSGGIVSKIAGIVSRIFGVF